MAAFQHFINSYLPHFWKRFLVCYVTFILVAHSILVSHSEAEIPREICGALFFAIILCPLVIKKVNNLPRIHPVKTRYNKTETALLFLIPFFVFLLQLAIYYPGVFGPDSISQYHQVLLHWYNDWHPVLATLISFKIPTLLFPGWIGFIVLFQLILFSCALGYCLCSVRQYTNRKITYILLAFFLLNPQTTYMAIYPWKDTLFALSCLVLVTFALHIYFTRGKWLLSSKHTCFVILFLVLTTLLRHNAILFTAPFMLALAAYTSRRRLALVFVTFCLLLFLVKGALFPFMKVVNPPQRKAEMLGLPMSAIGAVAAWESYRLDKPTRDLIEQIAPMKTWKEEFAFGWNSIKYQKETKRNLVENYGVKKILGIMKNCFKQAPMTTLKGMILVTHPVYSILDYHAFYPQMETSSNLYGIRPAPLLPGQEQKDFLSLAISVLFPHLFVYFGFMHLLLFLAWTTCSTLQACRKILLTLPVICYNFGTALLLSGTGDCWRFFFYTFLAVPVLLLLFFTQEPGKSKTADDK